MQRNKLTVISLALIVAMVLGAFSGLSFAQGETLNIIYWQAPSSLNPYLSGGTKEIHTSSVVIEPLAWYDENGNMVPNLAAEIPTVENGGVSEDLTTITWHLKEGVLWSDGTPFTANDVAFTFEYCSNEEMGCSSIQYFADVVSVEAVDDLTVLITFGVPKPFPYGPFVGATTPIIQAAQFADCLGAAGIECTEQNFNPIGTGPYMVVDFRPNDVVTYAANPNYREEGKPYFDTLVIKGGGEAEAAARAVLETGEADYAWNLQVDAAILESMESAGLGQVVVAFGTQVERIMVNQTNPSPDLGEDMRAVYMADGSNVHPFLTDPVVWQALSKAIDRSVIVDLYGVAGQATCNVVPAPAIYASPNNDICLTQDMDGAKAMLDDAGIVDTDGDGIREYNGMPLYIVYQTSTNAVRQATQDLVKSWWTELGVDVELRNIDASVFFGNDVASPDTYSKFYTDVEMYTNDFSGTDPESYMNNWACSNIPGPDNNWQGPNIPRYCTEEYDALLAELAGTASLDERAALVIQMNDMLMQSGVMLPLVHRGARSAHALTLEGVRMNAWDSELWNIADWARSS